MVKLKINVHGREGFTPAMTEKHITSAKLLEQAVNTRLFRDSVLAFSFTNTLGLNNGGIYYKIMTGAESLDPEVDYEADIWVYAYYQNNKVIGWTTPNVRETHLNTKFFNEFNYDEVAMNMFHEWLHKIGFDHSSASDYRSVPYEGGYLIRDIVRRLMNGEILPAVGDEPIPGEIPKPIPEPKKVLVCYRSIKTLFRKKCYYKELT